MISPENLNLLERYLARTLSAEEEQQLEARLLVEPELAQDLVTLAREEAMLVEWARATRESEAVAAAMTIQASTLEVASRRPHFLRRSQITLVLATLTACLLFVFARNFHVPDPVPRTDQVAQVKESVGDVAIITSTGEKVRARKGRLLYPGDQVETGGDNSFAVVQFASKARLEIGADSLVALLEGASKPQAKSERVSVLRGFVHGELPEGVRQHPMLLSTPHADVEMRGKKFSSWSEASATLIELEEGLAQLVRRADGQKVMMQQGTYVVAAVTEKRLISRPLPTTITQPEHTLLHNEGPVLALAYSPRGDALTTGGWKGTIRQWGTEMGEESFKFQISPEKRARVFGLGYSSDGKTLVTSSPDRHLRFWEPMTGKLRRTVLREGMEMKFLAFSPDRKMMATLGISPSKQAVVRICDSRNGRKKAELGEGKSRYASAAFFPDKSQIAVGTKKGTVQIWDLKRRRKLHEYRAHHEQIQALAISPDGKWLITSARSDHLVRVWSTIDFEEYRTLQGHGRGAQALAFSPEETVNVLAVASDGVVKIWDLNLEEPLGTLRADASRVTALAFSPDGLKLATAGWKRTVKVWDLMMLFCRDQ